MKRKVDVDRLLYVFNAVIQNLEDELRNIPKDDFDNIIKEFNENKHTLSRRI